MINWDVTPTIEEYLKAEKDDPNLWWRVACGHHQNLFEAAVERLENAGLIDGHSGSV